MFLLSSSDNFKRLLELSQFIVLLWLYIGTIFVFHIYEWLHAFYVQWLCLCCTVCSYSLNIACLLDNRRRIFLSYFVVSSAPVSTHNRTRTICHVYIAKFIHIPTTWRRQHWTSKWRHCHPMYLAILYGHRR